MRQLTGAGKMHELLSTALSIGSIRTPPVLCVGAGPQQDGRLLPLLTPGRNAPSQICPAS